MSNANSAVLVQAQNNLEPVKQSESGALMTIIERISLLPDLDLDRVERLFAMHQQMLARSAEQQFNEAMAITQSEIQSVAALKKNNHTKSVYADIDAIHEAAKPVWTRNGFSVVTRTAQGAIPNHIKVICDVRHSGGHKETYEDDWPLDTAGAQGNANKTAIQGKGSTTTYARRYTELMIFDIAIKRLDQDGNSAAKPPAKTEPAASANPDSKESPRMQAHNNVLRTQFTVVSAIKAAVAAKDYYEMAAQMDKLSEEEKTALWVAPSNGGIFTTAERAAFKSNEYNSARADYFAEKQTKQEQVK